MMFFTGTQLARANFEANIAAMEACRKGEDPATAYIEAHLASMREWEEMTKKARRQGIFIAIPLAILIFIGVFCLTNFVAHVSNF